MNTMRFLCLLLLFNLNSVWAHTSLQQAKDKLEAGYYHEAELQLQQLAKQTQPNSYDNTLIIGLQGLLALYRQQNETAEQLLSTAINQARLQTGQELNALFSFYLGQLYQQKANLKQAYYYNNQAIALAQSLNDKVLLIGSYTHAAKLALIVKDHAGAWTQLQQNQLLLEKLTPHARNSQLWLGSGYQLLQLYLNTPNKDYLAACFYQLNSALLQARDYKQNRLQSAALKHLATLYTFQHRPAEAINLLLEAISLAQLDNAEDTLIDLEWQLAELYKQQQQPLEAISAYKRALQHLESIRLDIPVSYENGRSSFKNTFAPLYLGLTDLLLQQAPLVNKTQQQILLHEVQNALELMKKSELEDYFKSRCNMSTLPLDLKKVDPHAAAIYPIQLADRLEIIVYTHDGLHQFTQAITSETIEGQARLFSKQLRNYRGFNKIKPSAEFLYNALIKPIESLLKEQHIDTLVYVPDNALRAIPLNALYDGKQFLIEQYAIVNSPGLSLIASNGNVYTQQAILFAGVSQLGDVVEQLPDSLLADLLVNNNSPVQDYLATQKQAVLHTEKTVEKTRTLRELLHIKTVNEKLKQALALPGVATEIKQLAQQNQMPYLLNEAFSLSNFEQTLNEKHYKILHIASHGFFGSTTEDSFIMTYDKILTMKTLEDLLSTPYFKKYPLDLIVFSACQSAEGDDRSPLGISGIAIKAKVHSAVGSLWAVSDEATTQLMTHFYEALKKPNISKAKALQEAEINLLKRFNNPSLWSPFILVGNWW
ncbi:MAG: CHAT domain-containing protein [Methylococcaceae bacterium]